MPPLPLYKVLILDLGDVLLTWSPETKTEVRSRIFQDMLSSTTWEDYERGSFSQSDCYTRLAAEFSLDATVIASAFQQARQSLCLNTDLMALTLELKSSDDNLQVYAITNMSIPDYDFIRQMPFEWSIFDAVFASGLIGERKPQRGIYDYFLAQTGIDPRSAVFVDDKPENISTARSLGMHGIRASRYLRANAGALKSGMDNGYVCMENFVQLLILELTGDESLVTLGEHPFLWNFFPGKPPFLDSLPEDLDTTSIAYIVLKRDPDEVARVMDEMLQWKTDRGTFFTYFDHTRRRVCPYVNVNVLTLFFRHGRGKELPQALDWVLDVLAHRRYLEGSRYYVSPDLYLYFMSRLFDCPFDEGLHGRAMQTFLERVKERIGVPGEPMDLALRVVVCHRVGIINEADFRKLLAAQLPDGGWEVGWMYRYGRLGIKLGSRGFTTALAIKAIQLASQNNLPLMSV